MTTINNIRFKIYSRFILIQTCRIFYFSRRYFAKHHTLSSGVDFSVAGLDRACLRRRRSEPTVYKWFRRVRGPDATQAKIAQNVAFLDFKVYCLLLS